MAYAPARPATLASPYAAISSGDSSRNVTAVTASRSLPIRRPDRARRRPRAFARRGRSSIDRLACVSRLAENRAVERDDRVDAQHGRVAPVDGASLAGRMLDRVVADLLVARRLDTERDPQLEDRPPLRRGRGKDDHPLKLRVSSDV